MCYLRMILFSLLPAALSCTDDGGYQPPKHVSATVINAQCRWLWCSRCPRSLHSRLLSCAPVTIRREYTRPPARLRYVRKLTLGGLPAISSTQCPECCRHRLRDRAAWCRKGNSRPRVTPQKDIQVGELGYRPSTIAARRDV